MRGTGGREIDKLRGIIPPINDGSGSEARIGSVTRAGSLLPGPDMNLGCAEVVLPDGRRMYLFEALAYFS
ncbi:MAG: hypothetical protein GX111_01465 [Clostridiales bacterium]|nr:hypothetical protein [Clostridiales bacterium]